MQSKKRSVSQSNSCALERWGWWISTFDVSRVPGILNRSELRHATGKVVDMLCHGSWWRQVNCVKRLQSLHSSLPVWLSIQPVMEAGLRSAGQVSPRSHALRGLPFKLQQFCRMWDVRKCEDEPIFFERDVDYWWCCSRCIRKAWLAGVEKPVPSRSTVPWRGGGYRFVCVEKLVIAGQFRHRAGVRSHSAEALGARHGAEASGGQRLSDFSSC